jgi:prevent-host-death family protein
MLHLRLRPARNGQRAALHWAAEYELSGAVAQLEERLSGTQEVGGSSPPSSTPSSAIVVGAHEFRNRFGLYMERAAAGEHIHISRGGRPFARLLPAENYLGRRRLGGSGGFESLSSTQTA